MAVQRYIGLIKEEGKTPPGLARIYAYGLTLDRRFTPDGDSDCSQEVRPSSSTAATRQDNAEVPCPRVDSESPKGSPCVDGDRCTQQGQKTTKDNKSKSPASVGLKSFIMDYYPGMPSLHDLLQLSMRDPSKTLPLSLKKRIARNMVEAVNSLAERQFFHLDIKPHNFLVDPVSGAVRLIDLEGIVNVDQFRADWNNAKEGCFSLKYTAPERFNDHLRCVRLGAGQCNPDVWSLGMSLIALFMPYGELDLFRLLGALTHVYWDMPDGFCRVDALYCNRPNAVLGHSLWRRRAAIEATQKCIDGVVGVLLEEWVEGGVEGILGVRATVGGEAEKDETSGTVVPDHVELAGTGAINEGLAVVRSKETQQDPIATGTVPAVKDARRRGGQRQRAKRGVLQQTTQTDSVSPPLSQAPLVSRISDANIADEQNSDHSTQTPVPSSETEFDSRSAVQESSGPVSITSSQQEHNLRQRISETLGGLMPILRAMLQWAPGKRSSLDSLLDHKWWNEDENFEFDVEVGAWYDRKRKAMELDQLETNGLRFQRILENPACADCERYRFRPLPTMLSHLSPASGGLVVTRGSSEFVVIGNHESIELRIDNRKMMSNWTRDRGDDRFCSLLQDVSNELHALSQKRTDYFRKSRREDPDVPSSSLQQMWMPRPPERIANLDFVAKGLFD